MSPVCQCYTGFAQDAENLSAPYLGPKTINFAAPSSDAEADVEQDKVIAVDVFVVEISNKTTTEPQRSIKDAHLIMSPGTVDIHR